MWDDSGDGNYAPQPDCSYNLQTAMQQNQVLGSSWLWCKGIFTRAPLSHLQPQLMTVNDNDNTAAQGSIADDALRGMEDSEDGGPVMAGLTPMWGEDTLGGGQEWNLTRCNSTSARQGMCGM